MNASTILLILATIIYVVFYHRDFLKYYISFLIPYFIINQLVFYDRSTNTSKKRFYMCIWKPPFDSQTYATSKNDITNLQKFIEKYNKDHNCKIGLTVFMMKLVGNILVKFPSINAKILFGQLIKEDTADISCLIESNEGHGFEIVTIKEVNKLSLEEIEKKIQEKKEKIDKNMDPLVKRKNFIVKILPSFLLAPFLRVATYLSAYGVDLTWFGFPRYWYGSAVIMNYGKMGLETFSYSPFTIGLSKITKKEKIDYVTKKNEVSNKLKIWYTINLRMFGNNLPTELFKEVEEIIQNPDLILDKNYFKPTTIEQVQ